MTAYRKASGRILERVRASPLTSWRFRGSGWSSRNTPKLVQIMRASYYILLSSLHARRCNEPGYPGKAATLAARIELRLCGVRSVLRDSLEIEPGEAQLSSLRT